MIQYFRNDDGVISKRETLNVECVLSAWMLACLVYPGLLKYYN